ncbi:hypothetical protein M127_2432, partial [Bacteroides fragilis str. S6L5]
MFYKLIVKHRILLSFMFLCEIGGNILIIPKEYPYFYQVT